MISRFLVALSGVLVALSALGQTPRPFAAEPIIIRHAETVWQMEADGTGVVTETMAVAVQTDAAVRQLGVVSTVYARQSQKADFVYARVHHADGTATETPLEGVQEQAAPVTQQAPAYSDVMIKQLPLKGLRVGDTVEWQTRTRRSVSDAHNQFWGSQSFVRGVVVEDQSIELRVPASVHPTIWTRPETGVQPVQSEAAGEHRWKWSWKQLDPTVGPEAEALKKARDAKPLSAAEQLDQKEGALPDTAWTTFPDWPAVGAWYRTLEADRMQPDSAIRAKVAEITAGKTTEEARVQAVYAWVSGQIRYIGVNLGIGRYQPHTAATIFENQYGDCKDKHTLLASMLLALGLQPDAVLIGAGQRFNEAVPSPASFNHLITRVQVDGKEIYLDSTAEVAGYRVLLPLVRDKQVLVVPGKGLALLAHTPADLPFPPESSFSVVGSLDGKLASDSAVSMTHHDDTEVLLRAGLRQVSPANYQEAVQGMMTSWGWAGKVSEVEILHVDDLSQPLTMRFHYHRDRDESWGENRITANFALIGLPAIDEKDPPRAPLELGLPRVENSTLELKLPQGWSMELPEAVHQHINAADCDVSYQLKGGSLLAYRKLTVHSATVSLDQLQPYAAWYTACGASGVPFLQLTAITGSDNAGKPSNAESRRLVNQANDEIRAGRYDAAEADLKAAQVLDPEQRDLQGDLGAVAMHRGDHQEAMRLYAREIELHPDAEFAYRNLMGLQFFTGNVAGAADTLTKWQKQTPANPAPSISAIELRLNQQDYAGALHQARISEASLTEEARQDERFRLALGKAEMRGGVPDQGEPLLRAIAAESKEALHRNDASYELALADRDLELADRTERAVLEELATESRNWTGSESLNLLRQKSSLITACWDTMGWILFREGKATEAEPWVRSAMTLRQSAEVGEHLGDILMAQSRPADAAEAYAQALAAFPIFDGMGVRLRQDTPQAAVVRTKMTTARQAAKLAKDPNGTASLQALRTWKLGAARGLNGTGEYQVLLSSNGVASAQPLSVPFAITEQMNGHIAKAHWSDRFPPGQEARIAARAMLNCHSGLCELVLEP